MVSLVFCLLIPVRSSSQNSLSVSVCPVCSRLFTTPVCITLGNMITLCRLPTNSMATVQIVCLLFHLIVIIVKFDVMVNHNLTLIFECTSLHPPLLQEVTPGFGKGQLSKLADVWTAEALFTTISRHVMGPTWPPIQWTVGALHSLSKSGQIVRVATHFHLMLYRMCALSSHLISASWHCA
jgi:hypothetical protein